MKTNTRNLLEMCIADGIKLGLERAYKSSHEPSDEAITVNVDEAIWRNIDHYFDFEDGYK